MSEPRDTMNLGQGPPTLLIRRSARSARRTRVRPFLRLALLATALGSLAAAEPPSAPLRIAVVAGNDLAGAGLRPLRYAARDAARIDEILTRLGGFQTTLLLGQSADAFL